MCSDVQVRQVRMAAARGCISAAYALHSFFPPAPSLSDSVCVIGRGVVVCPEGRDLAMNLVVSFVHTPVQFSSVDLAVHALAARASGVGTQADFTQATGE